MRGTVWYGDFFGNGILAEELVRVGFKIRPGRINYLALRLRGVRRLNDRCG